MIFWKKLDQLLYSLINKYRNLSVILCPYRWIKVLIYSSVNISDRELVLSTASEAADSIQNLNIKISEPT